ncbi:MAG TPA: MFS transporter [Longimicrobiales bacterium]
MTTTRRVPPPAWSPPRATRRHRHAAPPPALGLRANWRQFWLLVLVNAFVGAMVGLERAVLPLLAEREFGLASSSAALSFIATFGIAKAATNLYAGRLGDLHGRRRVLLAGWALALPVPLLVIAAPSWPWIVFANVLLGVHQGLAWSTAVIMKIDLVGPKQRGLAMGLNEFAGYLAVALAALGTGSIAEVYGLRPAPFYLGIAVAAAGLALSLLFVRETRGHAALEAALSTAASVPEPGAPAAAPPAGPAEAAPVRSRTSVPAPGGARPDSHPMNASGDIGTREIVARVTWRDPALASASQAGLVNNLNDGLAWGLLPLFFAAAGLSVSEIGVLAFIYPAVWGVLQLGTGALSDRIGRKRLIAPGMIVQAAALAVIALAHGFWPWAAAAALLGAGTAMVYPTLLAAVADVAHPSWRGSAVGVYRFWRDTGYAAGALLAGVLADAFGMAPAIGAIAALTLASGPLVGWRMPETAGRGVSGRRDR